MTDLANDSSNPQTEANGNGWDYGHTLWLGEISRNQRGELTDDRRMVIVEGQELARTIATAEGVVGGSNGTAVVLPPAARGSVTGCTGEDYVSTLFRTTDGRLVLHTEFTRCREDEGTLMRYTIEEVTAEDLGDLPEGVLDLPSAGAGSPLTLEDVLAAH